MKNCPEGMPLARMEKRELSSPTAKENRKNRTERMCRICGEKADGCGVTCKNKECKRMNHLLVSRDYRKNQLKGTPRMYPAKKKNRYKTPRTITMKNGVEVLNNIIYKAIRGNDYIYNPAHAVITHHVRFNGKKSKQHYGD